jgi:hypothetical protein
METLEAVFNMLKIRMADDLRSFPLMGSYGADPTGSAAWWKTNSEARSSMT